MREDKIPYLVENEDRDTFTFYVKETKPYLELQQRIDKAIEYIKEYGRDKQLEEDYLMNRYNLALYNITLLEILGDKENERNNI